MKVFKILFLLLITVLVPLNAQVTYFTNVSDKQIKTLQVKVAGEMFSDPFIELGGENRIEVNFDAFNPGFGDTPIIWFIATPIGRNRIFPRLSI